MKATGIRWLMLGLYIFPCSAMDRFMEDAQQDQNAQDEFAKSCYFTEDKRICNHCSDDNEFCMSEVCDNNDNSATEIECSVCASKVNEDGYSVYMDFCLDLYCDANTVFGGNGTMACRCQRAKVYGIDCDSCNVCGGGFSFESVAKARHIGEGMSLSCSAYENTDATESCDLIVPSQSTQRLRAGAIILTAVAVAFVMFIGALSFRRRRNGKQHRLSRSEIQAALNLEHEHIIM